MDDKKLREHNSGLRPAWARYGVAIGSVVLGWLAREALTPGIGPTALPFIFFFPAVAVAAWFGGFGPGILAITLSALTANWFFTEPIHAFSIYSIYDFVTLVAFLFAASVIVGAIHAMHRARARLVEEIVERKRAETELTKARDLLVTTVASIGDAVIVTDEQGNVTFLNPEAERLTGWKDSQVKGQPLPKVFHIVNEGTREAAESPVERVFRTGKVAGLANHTLLISKDGRETPIDDSAAPIRHTDGPLFGVVLVFRDVTAQREAQQTASHLAAVVEHSGDAIFTKNLNGVIQTWNPSAERLFGYRAEEIVGKPLTVLFPPDRLNEEDHIIGRLRQGQLVERLETIRVAKDGRRIPVSVSVSPLKGPNGEIVGASKIVHDISDIVAAREALTREKELLATTLASIGDAVIIADAKGRITYVNAEAERLTKWGNADAAGQPLPIVFRIVNEETRTPVESPVEKVLRLGGVVGLANHTVLIAKDGTETPIDDSAAPIQRPGGPLFGVVLVFRDFTERKRAEQRLAQFAAIVQHSQDAIVGKSLDGTVTSWNAGAEALFRYSPDEMIGQSIRRIIPSDKMAEEDMILMRLQAGESDHRETVRMTKDGRRVPVSITCSPMTDASGKVIGGAKIARDITEQKETEEKLREAQRKLLLHAADLEATVAERTAKLQETVNDLQSFSYSIAHDMRAPLRAMGTFAHLLMNEIPAAGGSKDMKTYCERIILGAERLDNLINDALNYTKAALQEFPVQQVDLSKLVRGLLDTYPNLNAEAADIQIDKTLPIVLGNEALLTQCFSNLLGNAVKFVAPGVRPKVCVRFETKNGFARIWVEDNGIGIPKHAQPRLFAMFEKLDNQYEGTGIGLAIVRKVIERMGGKVGVESEPGRGSRFWVELRVAPKEESV